MTNAGMVLFLWKRQLTIYLIIGKEKLHCKENQCINTHNFNPRVAVAIMLAGDECSGTMVAGAHSDENT